MQNKLTVESTDIEQYIDNNVTEQDSILFPVRKFNSSITSPALSDSFMRQLEILLSCPLCSCRMEDPVYLRCSHRFCRACLSKFLNEKRKKYCPACEMERPISACRRDMKADTVADQLIHKLNTTCQVDLSQHPSLVSHKRLKFPSNQQQQIEISKKKFRSNKYRGPKPSKVVNLLTPDKFNDESYSSTQLNSEPKNQNLQRISWQETRNDKNITIESKQEKENQPKLTSQKQLSSDTSLNQAFEVSYEPSHQVRKKDPIHQALDHFNSRFRERQLQMGQFSKNLSLDLNCSYFAEQKHSYLKIMLKKHPEEYLSPPLNFSEIVLSSNQTVELISQLIADQLNIKKKKVNLYLFNPVNKKCTIIPSNSSLSSFPSINFNPIFSSDLNDLLEQFQIENSSLLTQRFSYQIYYRVLL